MNICVFAYQFPHFKTEYGLKTLLSNGFNISLVIAQPFRKLNVPRSNYRISPKILANGDLEEICRRNNIKYIVTEHDSSQSISEIAESGADLGVILGARILKQRTIESFEKGIVNIHPGIIPDNRGLDNFKWAIINKLKLVNTAHFINSEIDLGDIIEELFTPVYKDDQIWDLYLRHFFSEFALMTKALDKVTNGNHIPNIVRSPGTYFSAVPPQIDAQFEEYFHIYVQEFHTE